MTTNKTLLSVSAGRHRLGYAIFRQGELIYYGMTKLKQFGTKQALGQAVQSFLEKTVKGFQIGLVAVRQLNKQQRRNMLLVAITDQVLSYCKQNGLPLSEFEGGFINEQFCNSSQRPTKEKTTQALIAKYPQLGRYHDRKQLWQKQYYGHLFQAIAVGLAHIKETQENVE